MSKEGGVCAESLMEIPDAIVSLSSPDDCVTPLLKLKSSSSPATLEIRSVL